MRHACLEQYPALALVPTRTTCQLRQELITALLGSELGTEQPLVRIQDADQINARKIKAFADHLRTNQNLNVTPLKGIQGPAVEVFGSDGVLV